MGEPQALVCYSDRAQRSFAAVQHPGYDQLCWCWSVILMQVILSMDCAFLRGVVHGQTSWVYGMAVYHM